MHVRLEPHFVVGDYVFVVRSSHFLASAADRFTFNGYSKFLPQRTGPYMASSVRLEFGKIAYNVIWNTVSI